MDYIVSCRNRVAAGFGNEIGRIRYMRANMQSTSTMRLQQHSKQDWAGHIKDELMSLINQGHAGHVIFYVHGFCTSQFDMIRRHKLIRKGLSKEGFRGVVISFDWPSDDDFGRYKDDKKDALAAAPFLFPEGIAELRSLLPDSLKYQTHIIAHSMGCFLVRNAFQLAKQKGTLISNWSVNEIAFVAADIETKKMSGKNPLTKALMRHCKRLTNYVCERDVALYGSGFSHGFQRRLGRTGMLRNIPVNAVDLMCGDLYRKHLKKLGGDAMSSHRWYFQSERFFEDLAHTFRGKLRRDQIPGRRKGNQSQLVMEI